jgi:hypothetical protein
LPAWEEDMTSASIEWSCSFFTIADAIADAITHVQITQQHDDTSRFQPKLVGWHPGRGKAVEKLRRVAGSLLLCLTYCSINAEIGP